MFIVYRILILVFVFGMVGCQKKAAPEVHKIKTADLSKAASYNLQLGLGYLKQGDRPRAKKKFLLAMEQEPNSPSINAAIAYFYEQTNEINEAQKYYLKSISLSNNGGAQLNNYGAFLCRQGDYQKAEQFFLKATKDTQYVNTPAAFENAGLCALTIPDNDKAKNYFNQALSQDPTRRESLVELVKLESKMGQDTEALNKLQKHHDLVLQDKIVLSMAKDIAIKAGKTEIAAQYNDYLQKLEINTKSSGVDHEYISNNG